MQLRQDRHEILTLGVVNAPGKNDFQEGARSLTVSVGCGAERKTNCRLPEGCRSFRVPAKSLLWALALGRTRYCGSAELCKGESRLVARACGSHAYVWARRATAYSCMQMHAYMHACKYVNWRAGVTRNGVPDIVRSSSCYARGIILDRRTGGHALFPGQTCGSLRNTILVSGRR